MHLWGLVLGGVLGVDFGVHLQGPLFGVVLGAHFGVRIWEAILGMLFGAHFGWMSCVRIFGQLFEGLNLAGCSEARLSGRVFRRTDSVWRSCMPGRRLRSNSPPTNERD